MPAVFSNSIYTVFTGIFLVYVILKECRYSRAYKKEIGFLKEYDDFLCDVRHYYYYHNTLSDAIHFSLLRRSGPFIGYATILSELADREGAGSEETAKEAQTLGTSHKFLRLFASLVLLVEENGDVKSGESTVFINSIMQLRSDVQTEKRFLDEKKHRFMGLTLTAALPILAVPYICDWAVGTIPSLLNFYTGRTGTLVKGLLLAISLGCYNAVFTLRSSGLEEALGREKSTGMQGKIEIWLHRLKEAVTGLVSENLLMFILTAVTLFSMLMYGHAETRKLLALDVSDVSNLCETADGKQMRAMETVIPQYMSRFIAKGQYEEIPDTEVLTEALLNEQGIRTKDAAQATAEELIRRMTAYGREYFGIIDIIVILIGSFGAYFIPFLGKAFTGALKENRMQDEVMQFQSLIHMQKDVPGMTAVTLLESMEEFADVFRDSIRRCINEYGTDDTAALNNLAKAEDYPSFVRIVDCFLAIDEAGVSEAFGEVTAEIVSFKENRRLERSILLDNDCLLGSLLSVLPGGLILFGYLLVPFMLRSISMFDSYQDVLKTYMN